MYGQSVRNLLTVPVVDASGQVVGVLQAANKLHGHFSFNDEVLLQCVAAYVGPSIVKAIHLSTLQQLVKDMRTTQRLLRQQCLEYDLQALLATIEEQAAGLLAIDASVDEVEVWVVDAAKQQLVLHTAGAESVTVPLGTGLMGKAVARNAVITINDLKSAKLEAEDLEIERMDYRANEPRDLHAIMCVPVPNVGETGAAAVLRICIRASPPKVRRGVARAAACLRRGSNLRALRPAVVPSG